MDIVQKQMLQEREVIIGITSTACRLIGLCVRDGRKDLIDKTKDGPTTAINGLEDFGGIAGCDSGLDWTVIALYQIVTWMKKRDHGAAEKAFNERYKTSDAEFCASMRHALDEANAKRCPKRSDDEGKR